MSDRTPYRLVVSFRTLDCGRAIIPRCTIVAWTSEQHYQEARLPSAGSFLFPGMHAVRREAMKYLAMPNVEQVSVRTNHDRQVYRYFRHADGKVTGYCGGAN